jgi:hypothetical protein
MIALLLLMILSSPPDINEANKLTVSGDYESSATILSKIKPNHNTHSQYCFLMAVNAFQLNQKDVAKKWLDVIENSFDPMPQRYVTLAKIMNDELLQWKKDDLGDVSRKMQIVENRLQVAKGGPKTQQIQKEIVDNIDSLIKKLEDKIKQQETAAQSTHEKNKPTPMQDSIPVGGGAGPGHVDPKKLKHIAENWGKMPEKERAKTMMDITKDLPPRYREVIENYFKSLAANNPR